MQRDERLGTLEDVVRDVDDQLRAIVMALRELIITVDPETVEQPRPGDRALSYGTGPQKMKQGYAYIMPQRHYVNLGFYQGTALPDPLGLLEGTGTRLRHVKVHSLAEVDRPGLRELVAAAATERRAAA